MALSKQQSFKPFDLNLLSKYYLETTTTESGRIYHTPDGDFDSVTTILGRHFPFDKEAWEARVGHDEAQIITAKASRRGTELHNILEKFLLNEEYFKDVHSVARMRFEPVAKRLSTHIGKVYGAEVPMWSKRLKTAGKADGIVTWDDKLAILDLKTSRGHKKEEHITSYFVQATAYGILLEERYGMTPEKIIIMFSDDDFNVFSYEKNFEDFRARTEDIFCKSK